MSEFNSEELDRLSHLMQYQILDTAPEPEFDKLVELAAQIAEAPIASITLVDRDRQWFKAVVGVEFQQLQRNEGFSYEVIEKKATLVVEDTLLDERFARCPQVVGEPHIRFYAGIPLLTPSGFVIGALTVLDKKPRKLSDTQLESLQSLATATMANLEDRRRTLAIAKAAHYSSLHLSSFPLEEQKKGQVGIWEVELPSRKVNCSSEFRSLIRLPEESPVTFEMLSQMFDRRMNHLLGKATGYVKAGIPCGTLFEGEIELRKMDGTYSRVFSGAEIQCNAEGEITRIIGYCVDLLRSQSFAEPLEKSERLFRKVADTLPDILWSAEPDGTVTYVNKAGRDFLGITTLAHFAQEWAKLLHPQDATPIMERWMQSVQSEADYYAEFRLWSSAKECYRRVAAQAKPSRDKNGKILKWYGFVIDIQDRKHDSEMPLSEGIGCGQYEDQRHSTPIVVRNISETLGIFSRGILTALHAETEAELLDDLCQIILKIAGPLAIWVAYPAEDNENIFHVVAMGESSNAKFTHLLAELTKPGTSVYDGLIATMSGQKAVVIEVDEAEIVRRTKDEPNTALGIGRCIFIPLETTHESLGVLSLCYDKDRDYQKQELELLEELGTSIAGCIESLRRKEYERRLEECIANFMPSALRESGQPVLDKLVVTIAEALGACAGFVARVFEDNLNQWRFRTVAACANGQKYDNFDCLLEKTFHEKLRSSAIYIQANEERERLPSALMSLGVNAKACAVHRLDAGTSLPMGLLVFLFDKPVRWPELVAPCLQIAAEHAVVELERQANFLNKMTVLDKAQDAIIVRDVKNKILFWNQSAERLYGWSKEEVLGKAVGEFYFLDHALLEQATSHLMKTGEWNGEVTQITKSGSTMVVECRWSLLEDDATGEHYILAANTDLTQRKADEERIFKLALFDELTGLPNRRRVMERLTQVILAKSQADPIGAMLLIDLDNFKDCNSFGHVTGDELLKEAASRISSCLSSEDMVARLGGDEFVILVEYAGDAWEDATQYAEQVYEHIHQAFKLPFYIDGHTFHCTLSAGISLFNGKPDNAELILKQADMALYQAKSAGRNTMRFFDPLMQQRINAKNALTAKLRVAVKEREFILYCQPQIHRDGTVMGGEALLRWPKKRKFISPAEFIPLAEETGIILEIGQQVLEMACMQLAAWANHIETETLTLSVNVSARQFYQPDFVGQVQAALRMSGINPSKLKLELTESMLVSDVEDAIAKMLDLKKCGLTFSLDDFGTGYSSLSYLRRLPFDQLKIDQSFISNMLVDNDDKVITTTILTLAKNLEMTVVAEGVETREQFEFLVDHGCEGFQGYFFSPPVSGQEFLSYLKSRKFS